MKDDESMLAGLDRALRRMIPDEVIDGARVEDAAESVMLEVAVSPIIPHPVGPGWEYRADLVPETVKVWPCDGVWAYTSERKVPTRLDERTHKVMRARYLLVRGWYAKHLHAMSPPMKREVLPRFFPEGVCVPAMLEARP